MVVAGVEVPKRDVSGEVELVEEIEEMVFVGGQFLVLTFVDVLPICGCLFLMVQEIDDKLEPHFVELDLLFQHRFTLSQKIMVL